MNKTKIQKLAQDSAAASNRPKQVVPVPPAADDLCARLYVALVGSSDFLRTQASPADVCRMALKRAQIAARVWSEERDA